MFQEATHDRPHLDGVGDSWDAGPEPADAPDDQRDRHPGLTGPIQGADQGRLGEEFIFATMRDGRPMRAASASASMAAIVWGEARRATEAEVVLDHASESQNG